MASLDFVYVDSLEKLKSACNLWESAGVIGVDLECENNLHHYGVYITLIQISTINKNWIIDPLAFKDFSPLIKIFSDKKVQKIFHDVNFDLRIINHQFGCHVKNVFDTQVAASFLDLNLGLANLLKTFFNVDKDEHFQMADWTKRPLSKDMLSYAVKDSLYLIPLRNILRNKLIDKSRLDWALEEFALLDKTPLNYSQGSFFDVRGIKSLSDNERSIVKSLFLVREKIAKKVDRPVHFIIPNKRVLEIASSNFSLNDWKNIRAVHPVVRANANLFDYAFVKGKNSSLPLPKVFPKRFSQKQKEFLAHLLDIRDSLSSKLGLQKQFIVSKDVLKELVISDSLLPLRTWQSLLLCSEDKQLKLLKK